MEGLTYSNYKFLEDLGIQADNQGCYRDGEWVGNGNNVISLNPHNNKSIAQIKLASEEDYKTNIQKM